MHAQAENNAVQEVVLSMAAFLRREEGAAQKRYCTCGRPVFVHYKPGGTSWSATFGFSPNPGRNSLTTCPICGGTLDIDRLL